MRDFISSFMLVTGWLVVAMSVYMLFWVVVMPGLAFIPFVKVATTAFLLLYGSKKLDGEKKV